MNERNINDLAVKSGLAEDMGRGYKFPDNYLDFAELIVRECSKHIRDRAMRAGGACTIVGEESLWLAKDLEEHFGVEP